MNLIIPAYKPDNKMLAFIDKVIAETDYRIIVVNDGSGELFDEVFDKIPGEVICLKHEVNRGKGAAMKTAFRYILDNNFGDGAVLADADGQHLIHDTKAVVEVLKANPDNLVLGCRQFSDDIPWKSRVGNKLTCGVYRLCSGRKLSDTQTGLRAMGTQLIKKFLTLSGDRYEYEMNMLMYCAAEGIKFTEVPITTVYHDEQNSDSHFNPFKDSLKIYGVILGQTLGIFTLTSLTCFALDFGLLMLLHHIVDPLVDPNTSLLISVGGARLCSSLVNYMLNKNIAFRGNHGEYSFLKYYGLVGVILGLKYGIIWLLNIAVGLPLAWANIITETMLFFVSYIAQRVFVFKPKAK